PLRPARTGPGWRRRWCATGCCSRSPPRPRTCTRMTWSRRCCARCLRRAPRPAEPGAAMAWDPIPPEVRGRLRTLRIGSRRAAGGRGFGQHRSRERGAGLEFVQYRNYEPGDEPRRIDWKLYARSDRLFVRDAERESQLSVWVLLDTSASMGQADAARPDWSRLDAARALAACIFEVALGQGDPFGLALVGGGGLSLLPPAAGVRQRDRLLLALREA